MSALLPFFSGIKRSEQGARVQSLNHIHIFRPLSTLRHRFSNFLLSVLIIWKRWSIPLLLLATIVLFFYMICDQLGFWDFFIYISFPLSLRWGFRTLSFFLIKMGCSVGLALKVGFTLRELLPRLFFWLQGR